MPDPRPDRPPDAGQTPGSTTGSTPSPAPGQRLRASLGHPSRGQAVVAVLVGLLMFAAVTQVRLYSTSNPYSGLRQSDLVQALNGLQAAGTRADAEIRKLTTTRDRLQNSSEQRNAALAQANHELNTLGILAGTAPAVGPGIEIVVDDTRGEYQVNHLLDGIEELRDAGAEAISINHRVRVVAQSWFEDAEHGIEIDGRLVTAPYTIDVIGDPDTLSKALDFPGGFKDDVALDHGTTQVRKLKRVRIDAVREAVPPQYAQSTQTR